MSCVLLVGIDSLRYAVRKFWSRRSTFWLTILQTAAYYMYVIPRSRPWACAEDLKQKAQNESIELYSPNRLNLSEN